MKLPTQFGFEIEVRPGSYFAQAMAESQTYEDRSAKLVLSLIEPGDLCVDAGAYIGWYSMLMASKLANVIAIEPNPELHSILKRNLASCSAPTTLFPYAVSDVDGEADFFLPSEYDDGWGSLAAADRGDRNRRTTVTTRRLDTLLDFRPQLKVKLLKMDVEGAEVPALRGLGSILGNIQYILIECIDIPARVQQSGSTVAGINEILRGWNVKRERCTQWETVNKAIDCGENFLFTNPEWK